jgi:hypothetical protein
MKNHSYVLVYIATQGHVVAAAGYRVALHQLPFLKISQFIMSIPVLENSALDGVAPSIL